MSINKLVREGLVCTRHFVYILSRLYINIGIILSLFLLPYLNFASKNITFGSIIYHERFIDVLGIAQVDWIGYLCFINR